MSFVNMLGMFQLNLATCYGNNLWCIGVIPHTVMTRRWFWLSTAVTNLISFSDIWTHVGLLSTLCCQTRGHLYHRNYWWWFLMLKQYKILHVFFDGEEVAHDLWYVVICLISLACWVISFMYGQVFTFPQTFGQTTSNQSLCMLKVYKRWEDKAREWGELICVKDT